jgi:hypothetical protein
MKGVRAQYAVLYLALSSIPTKTPDNIVPLINTLINPYKLLDKGVYRGRMHTDVVVVQYDERSTCAVRSTVPRSLVYPDEDTTTYLVIIVSVSKTPIMTIIGMYYVAV